MRAIVRFPAALLGILMVVAPLSTSACDLSCWLNQASSDCHSAISAGQEQYRMMVGPSEMDMGSGAGMVADNAPTNVGPNYSAHAAAHHVMNTQMDMVRSSLQAAKGSEASSSTALHRSKAISPCSQEACSQAAVSASPPSAGRSQPAHLQCVAIHVSNPAAFSKNYHRIGSGTAPPINLPVSLLLILRI